MPLDLQRGGHGDDPLVVLIPYLDDDISEIPLASRPVPISAELGALVITQEVGSMPDIEIVASHPHLLFQGMTPDPQEGFRAVTKSLPGHGILYRERAGG